MRQGIAYQVIGGPRFYERAEVKDLIAYLQVIDNPFDTVALLRIANRPRRGIGDSSVARLQNCASGAGARSGRRWSSRRKPASARSREGGEELPHDDPVADVRARSCPVAELVEDVLERSGYIDVARGRAHDRGAGPDREPPGARRRRAGVPASRRRSPTLSSFLQEISLYSDQDAIRGDGSLVTLMTLHNAKGLEFRAVFMIGMEEGIFPHARSIEEKAIEEERRLGLRRHDARERAADAHCTRRRACCSAGATTTSRRASSTSSRRARRARAAAPARGRATAARAGDRAAHGRPDLLTGDSVRHDDARRGRRHADRGRRRRHGALRRRRHRATLVLDYAPLEKIA